VTDIIQRWIRNTQPYNAVLRTLYLIKLLVLLMKYVHHVVSVILSLRERDTQIHTHTYTQVKTTDLIIQLFCFCIHTYTYMLHICSSQSLHISTHHNTENILSHCVNAERCRNSQKSQKRDHLRHW